jgi:uncharacterized protein
MGTVATTSLIDTSLAEVRRIVLSGLGSLKASVYLFGSRAVGTGRENSDIDVAVLPLEPLAPGTLAGIREALEESHVPWRVDLVDLSTATPELRASVENEGIRWSD